MPKINYLASAIECALSNGIRVKPCFDTTEEKGATKNLTIAKNEQSETPQVYDVTAIYHKKSKTLLVCSQKYMTENAILDKDNNDYDLVCSGKCYWIPWANQKVIAAKKQDIENSKAEIVMTSLLSGCRCSISDNGFLHVAHLQPKQDDKDSLIKSQAREVATNKKVVEIEPQRNKTTCSLFSCCTAEESNIGGIIHIRSLSPTDNNAENRIKVNNKQCLQYDSRLTYNYSQPQQQGEILKENTESGMIHKQDMETVSVVGIRRNDGIDFYYQIANKKMETVNPPAKFGRWARGINGLKDSDDLQVHVYSTNNEQTWSYVANGDNVIERIYKADPEMTNNELLANNEKSTGGFFTNPRSIKNNINVQPQIINHGGIDLGPNDMLHGDSTVNTVK